MLKILNKIEDVFCAVSLLLTTLILFVNVVLRYVFSASTSWAEEMIRAVDGNFAYACGFIAEHFPGVKVMRPQGTYMLYLDCEQWCREHNTDIETLQQKGVEYGVLWQDGRPFHRDYAIRMNLAVPHSLVVEAFDRLDKYVFNAETHPDRE